MLLDLRIDDLEYNRSVRVIILWDRAKDGGAFSIA